MAAHRMRMQTLSEQAVGTKVIVMAYAEKQCKLSSVESICQCIDKTGLAMDWRAGSGPPKGSCMAETEMLKARN